MNKLLATLVTGFFVVGAFAQAPAAPSAVPAKTTSVAMPAKAETKEMKADVKTEMKADTKADMKADTKVKAEKKEAAKAEKKAAKAATMTDAPAVKADAKVSPAK